MAWTPPSPRMKAAFRRVDAAAQHVANVLREIQAARADLSSVVGAPSVTFVTLSRIAELANRELQMLAVYATDVNAKCELDHDPSPQELRCGHGPQHGCGKGRK